MSSLSPAERVWDIRGQRGALSVERATELAAPILVGGDTSAERAVLSTWALSPASAAVVARALAALPGLTAVDASDIVAGRPEAEALEVYRVLSEAFAALPGLVDLDLSDNAFGPKGLAAFHPSLVACAGRLRRARFCNGGVSAETAEGLREIFVPSEGASTSLELLHFALNMMGDGGAIAAGAILASSPRMADFRFSSCRGGSRGGAAIAAGLRTTVHLVSLDVSDNSFGPGSTALLAASLAAQPLLTSLNASDIGAEDDGIVALSTALRGSTRALVRLDLSTNEMMGEGAKALASLVKRLRALTSLRFADNDELGGAGARAIARAVLAGPQRTLTALDASGCRLKDGGVAALAAAAAACPALVTCGLDGSRLTPGGLAAAVKALTDAGKAAPAMDECEEPDEDEDEEEEEGEGSDAESEDSRGGAAAADRDGDVDKLADMMRAL